MAQKNVEYVVGLRDQFTRKMSRMDQTTNRFNRSIGGTIARFATFAAVGGVLVNATKKMANFEEQVSNLSAITGATGADLDFLKAKAIELGGATTKSSIDTVKAFKLIASAKPELLENAQLLASTTKEAIALSEASGMQLPDAATSLASALNQFNLSADQSSRVINVLAAGSKFASAEIPDLTGSLEEFGGVAQSLEISIEESAAAVETLSEKNLKGKRAGIQIRNVLLKMASSVDKNVNPKVVGLSQSLENLAVIQDDTAALAKMFGTENILAAQTLIKQRNRVDELTKSLTGTNIAYEQQRINTDNLNSDVKILSSSWEKFVLNLNSGEGAITNFLRRSIQGLTILIDKFDELNKTAEQAGSSTAQKAFDQTEKFYIDREKTIEDKLRVISDLVASYNNELAALDKKDVGFFTRKSDQREIDEQKAKYNELIKIVEAYKQEILNPKKKPKEFIDPTTGLPTGTTTVQGTKITAAAPKIFNININNLVETFNVNSSTIKEGAISVRQQIEQALAEALADVQTVAG